MWKIKKEYHARRGCFAPKDRYINNGDLVSIAEGENVNREYSHNDWEYKCNYRGEKLKCPHLVFPAKEEAIKTMETINDDDTYCLCVKFHHSWTLENN